MENSENTPQEEFYSEDTEQVSESEQIQTASDEVGSQDSSLTEEDNAESAQEALEETPPSEEEQSDRTEETGAEFSGIESESLHNNIPNFQSDDYNYKSAPFFKSLFTLKFGDISIVHRIIASFVVAILIFGAGSVFIISNLNAYVQWQVLDGTSLMFNGNVGYNHLRSSDLNLTNKYWDSFFYTQLTQKLPWKLRLTANVGEWTGGGDGLYSKGTTSWFYGFGLQRSFLKEDRLTVRLNAQRPFSGRYSTWRSDFTQGDYTGFARQSYKSRSFSISVSYRFGSLRTQVKKTSATIDNNDVVGGSSAGGNQQGGGQPQGGN